MQKTILLILFCLPAAVSAAQQPPRMTEAFFKDPDVNISTPSISIKEDRFASYHEIIDWLESRARTGKNMRIEYIGSSSGGYAIPIVKFSGGKGSGKMKIWMQGALHGNEPAGAEGLFMLIDNIIDTGKENGCFPDFDLTILPIANIDGYLAMKRFSADGYDLNRDQTKFSDPVSKIIKKAMMDFNPDMAFDFHEFQPTRKEYKGIGSGGGSILYDVLFLPTGYLNVPEELREVSVGILQKEAEKVLERNKYTHCFYFSANASGDELILSKGAQSPQSSSTSYALSNAVSMLVEIRGIGMGKTSLKRRTYCTYLVAREFLNSAVKHKKEIKKALDKAGGRTIAAEDKITVISEPAIKRFDISFIDIGTNKVIRENIKVKDAMESVPALVRERPAGYILDNSCKAEIERLKLLGVRVSELPEDKEFNVECFKITGYEEAPKVWEKIKTVSVKTVLCRTRKIFPAGSYYIDMAQENANYAVSVLEPESKNGFVSFRVTETAPGETLKVFRVIN